MSIDYIILIDVFLSLLQIHLKFYQYLFLIILIQYSNVRAFFCLKENSSTQDFVSTSSGGILNRDKKLSIFYI